MRKFKKCQLNRIARAALMLTRESTLCKNRPNSCGTFPPSFIKTSKRGIAADCYIKEP